MPAHQPPDELLLSLASVVKDFPGTRALDGVDLELLTGEIHALVGENGSGKSTTVKIISGVIAADTGTLELLGTSVAFASPLDALTCGIATVYQEIHLVPLMTVAQNLLLGVDALPETRSEQLLLEQAKGILERLGAQFSLAARISELDQVERRFVQITRSVLLAKRVLILDEPTEGLSNPQYEALQALLRDLSGKGTGIIYVSHRLQEVMDIADRISVLRDGRRVATVRKSETTRKDLIRMMVGRTPNERANITVDEKAAEPILQVKELARRGYFENISLEVNAGEIVGLAGVLGSRKSELLRAICGADPYDAGTVQIEGRLCPANSPRDAVAAGLVFLPADRKEEGLLLSASVRTNIILPRADKLSTYGIRHRRRETAVATRYVETLDIRARGIKAAARTLSGGNQQKVLFARILHADARAILMDEPTQGVDIAGKGEIHTLIQEQAQRGAAILIASSEMDELIKLCHRILVIRLGELVGEFTSANADPEAILHLALP